MMGGCMCYIFLQTSMWKQDSYFSKVKKLPSLKMMMVAAIQELVAIGNYGNCILRRLPKNDNQNKKS